MRITAIRFVAERCEQIRQITAISVPGRVLAFQIDVHSVVAHVIDPNPGLPVTTR